MTVRLTCHLVSGEQVEILSDKEQGLQAHEDCRTINSASAHGRVIARGDKPNREEYGGEG
jgi:hypothetical protein